MVQTLPIDLCNRGEAVEIVKGHLAMLLGDQPLNLTFDSPTKTPGLRARGL
jgi:hypothetical protein